METYYKENIGLFTPQENPLDYFNIELIGWENVEGKSGAQINFYLLKEDAQAAKTPNATRSVLWDQVSDVIPQLQAELFAFDTIQTTVGETITLKDPTKL